MAANKFATMVHRNTNKMTLILIYAVLEWVLIILLLLNSLFSYLIVKFADYFGLKPPCPWCSRIDHFINPKKSKDFQRDLLCEVHAAEISNLGYCSNHRKLAESQDLCEDCSSSRPENHGFSRKEDEKVKENGGLSLKRCSCCGVSLDFTIKPAWRYLDGTQKTNLIAEERENGDQLEEADDSDRGRLDLVMDRCQDEAESESKTGIQSLSEINGGFGEKEEDAEMGCSVSVPNSGNELSGGDEDWKIYLGWEAEKEEAKNENLILVTENPPSGEAKEDPSFGILAHHLEFFLGHDGYRLIPVELIEENCEADLGSEPFVEAGVELVVEERETEPSAHESTKFALLESMEMEENEDSLVFHAKECDLERELCEGLAISAQEKRDADEEEEEEKNSEACPASEEALLHMATNETEAEVSIGTEIPDLELTDDIQNHEILANVEQDHGCEQAEEEAIELKPISVELREINELEEDKDHECEQAEEEAIELKPISVELREQHRLSISSEINEIEVDKDHVCEQAEEEAIELKPISVEARDQHSPLIPSEINEIEEEKIPDTPTSIDSFHQLHKKLLLLEKRESGTDESLDGSVVSEPEGADGITSMERLKAAFRAERKVLHALYTELEEERSASAVAANQTMAMINRLQEEKAAMQMEALQYQRMMEEQSEYDQEALQLLNELMVKREREKQELERELEVYRKRVLDYEAKEKMRIVKRSKDGSSRSESSCASSSHAGESDGLSIDLNQEAKDEDGLDQVAGIQNTPIDEVLNLEESLANFEEERLLILEQLKVLEEKLFTLADEEEQIFEDVKPIEHFYEENGNHVNGIIANGFSKETTNGKLDHDHHHHQEGRLLGGTKGKRLLPLFDAISAENGEGETNGHENGYNSDVMLSSNVKRIEIEEEVDHLYERLQALEADREFLKHCISSLKKGDKGMDLLQEILQHLRDLRNVELRVRNLGDSPLV